MARGKHPGLGIRRRNGRFAVEARIDGRAFWVGTFDTEHEAAHAGYKRRNEILEGRHSMVNPTVESFLADSWVEKFRPNAKDSTRATYGQYIRRVLDGDLGRAEIISPSGRVRPLKEWRMSEFTRTMAKQVVRLNPQFARFLAAVFSSAYDEGIIPETHFRRLGIGHGRGRKDIVPVTVQEVHLLADTARAVHPGEFGQRVAALMLWQAFVATRPGEAFAVRSMDIDHARREVNITRSVFEGRAVDTKTYKTRLIVIPDVAYEAVMALPARAPDKEFFTGKQNQLMRKSVWWNIWAPVRSAWEAKLDPRRKALMDEARGTDRNGRQKQFDFYELRHFGATNLLDNGASLEDVAYQLGHADTRLVESLYGHPNESLIRDRLRMAANASPVSVGSVVGSKVANG